MRNIHIREFFTEFGIDGLPMRTIDGIGHIDQLHIYSAVSSRHETVMLLRRNYETLSKAVDEQYAKLKEAAEFKHQVGWVEFRRALQGTE